MATVNNWQKVEHELYQLYFRLNEMVKEKSFRRLSPQVRAHLQQLADVTREAASVAHEKRDFYIEVGVYVQHEMPVEPDRFDEDGFPAHWE